MLLVVLLFSYHPVAAFSAFGPMAPIAGAMQEVSFKGALSKDYNWLKVWTLLDQAGLLQ